MRPLALFSNLFIVSALVLTLSSYGANTISWVPYHKIDICKAVIETDPNGIKIEEGLSHLALQFWIPDPSTGSVKYYNFGSSVPTDTDVQYFNEWGNLNDVKIMLGIFNEDSTGWSWNLVKPILDDAVKRQFFVNALVNEVNRLDLDGIDLDLEGVDLDGQIPDQDKANFIAFLSSLSNSIYSLKKLITVTSFPSTFNQPNLSWWNDMLPFVQGITSMGYEGTGLFPITPSGDQTVVEPWQSYAFQMAAISDPNKLMIGMPTYSGADWQGNTVLEQVTWAAENAVGVAIWDCSLLDSGNLPNESWQDPLVWDQLKKIKKKNTSYVKLCEAKVNNFITYSLLLGQVPPFLQIGDAIQITGRLFDRFGFPEGNSFFGVQDGFGMKSTLVQTDNAGNFSYSTNVLQGTHGPRNIAFLAGLNNSVTYFNCAISVPDDQNLFTNEYLHSTIGELNTKYMLNITDFSVTQDGVPYWVSQNYLSSVLTINSEFDVNEDNYYKVIQDYEMQLTNPWPNNPRVLERAYEIRQQIIDENPWNVIANIGEGIGTVSQVVYLGAGSLCASTLAFNPAGPVGCSAVVGMAVIDIGLGISRTILEVSGMPQDEVDVFMDGLELGTVVVSFALADGAADIIETYLNDLVPFLGDMDYQKYQIDEQLKVSDAAYKGYINGTQPFTNGSYQRNGELFTVNFSYQNHDYKAHLKLSKSDIQTDNSLIAGTVTPSTGIVDQMFEFSTIYTSTGSIAPDANSIKVVIDGQENVMTASGSNWEEGETFRFSRTFAESGLHSFYFTAVVNGQTLRYPESGVITFNVTESATGWRAVASDLITPGSSFNPGATLHTTAVAANQSAFSYMVYFNLGYKFSIVNQSGAVISEISGVIDRLAANEFRNLSSDLSIPSGTAAGIYQVIFQIYPQKDEDTSDNTVAASIRVGSSQATEQWYFEGTDSWIRMSPTDTKIFDSKTYQYMGTASGGTKINMLKEGAQIQINVGNFRTDYNYSPSLAYICHMISGDDAYVSFGKERADYVTFDQTMITCSPGEEINFIAHCTAASITGDPTIFRNATVSSWPLSFIALNGGHQAQYRISVPSNAALGAQNFFIVSRVGSNAQFLRELNINIVGPLPNISSLSKASFSAGDQIAIIGNNFGTNGSIKLNSILAGAILSRTNVHRSL